MVNIARVYILFMNLKQAIDSKFVLLEDFIQFGLNEI